jgi:S1-C subfamily serine protease
MKKMIGSALLAMSLFMVTQAYGAHVATALLQDEQNTVSIFKNASQKVVYVHRLTTEMSRLTKKKEVHEGTGSGFIWDNKGHIVTNYHVVKGASKLAVTIGATTVPVKIIGVEPRKDIAVLEIQSARAVSQLKSFTPFEMVHLQDLIVGQKAIAIGNPYGLDHSLSQGVISALGRKVPGIGGVTIHNMIQTDTPINPGNSGGPLLNSAGQLIGMNSMIYSRSGASGGVGFAVPAEDIERVVSQIIAHGHVVLSGIGIQPVPPGSAQHLGVKKGILIASVLPGTPAAHAKLHGTHRDAYGRVVLGDIIVALNAHPIASYDVLYNMLTNIKVGAQVSVSIQRGNIQRDVILKTIDISRVKG